MDTPFVRDKQKGSRALNAKKLLKMFPGDPWALSTTRIPFSGIRDATHGKQVASESKIEIFYQKKVCSMKYFQCR